MQTTPTVTATDADRIPSRSAWTIHGVAALWIVFMFVLAEWWPASYTALLQEDFFVEWLTVALFAAAGTLTLRNAFESRSAAQFLIGMFCMFVAGEEFSWGQRLLGFTPPDVFLEHNTQQEFTLHNFADVFGKPKGVLIAALLAYAVLLPLLARAATRVRALRKLGMRAPPKAVLPWLVICAVLLFWYPLEYSGEWVEAMAGGLFLAGARAGKSATKRVWPIAVLAALLLTLVSSRGTGQSGAAIACAQREAHALLADMIGGAATEDLLRVDGSIHKRIWSAIDAGYIDYKRLSDYARAGCGDSQSYVIDPWGMAYWIRVSGTELQPRRVTVYSFGPNRKRDSTAERGGGDDVLVVGLLR